MFQKMTDAACFGRFVAGTGAYEETTSHGVSTRIAFGQDFQAIIQLMPPILHE